MTREEFEKKFDKYGGTAIIHDITIYYDIYTIDVKNGEEVVNFFNEGGYSIMCCVNLKDIDLTSKIHEEIEMLKTERILLHKQARITILDRIKLVDNARLRTIKEFESKIHEKLHEAEMHGNFEPVVTPEMFDSVIKEMVGEDK